MVRFLFFWNTKEKKQQHQPTKSETMVQFENFIGDEILTPSEFNTLYTSFHMELKGQKITFRNIIRYTIFLMQIVGKIRRLPGEKKKKIVLHFIQWIIQSSADKEETKIKSFENKFGDLLFEEFLSNVIDTLISVENNKLKFNKKGFMDYVKKLKTTCSSCKDLCCCLN